MVWPVSSSTLRHTSPFSLTIGPPLLPGEIGAVIPIEGEPMFDAFKPGWYVYPPGSAHHPTVSGGEAYVVYGQLGGVGNIDLTTLTTAQGFIIQGDVDNDQLGVNSLPSARAGIAVTYSEPGSCNADGSAEDLYDSITQKLYTLPESTRVFVGHDYQPGGRELKFETTIGEEKVHNKHLKATDTKEQFVEFRTARDKTLRPPNLIFQSLQVNAQAGVLPNPDSNGLRYLKLPMGVFA